jgi:hypothetical protein
LPDVTLYRLSLCCAANSLLPLLSHTTPAEVALLFLAGLSSQLTSSAAAFPTSVGVWNISAVIPGKALTTADLLKLDQSNTRAKETLWILHLK